MSKFVHEGRVDLIAEDFLVAFSEVPKILEEQDDLRRHRHRTPARRVGLAAA